MRTLVAGQFRERNPEVSRDGHWLAYQSDESGAYEVYVRPFPDVGKGKWQVSERGGTRPLWAHNGKELFYAGGDQTLMSVTFTEKAGAFVRSTPAKLFVFPQLTGGVTRTFDVSTDDQRFVIPKSGANPERAEFRVVVNWLEELKKKVPVK
jgi:serine/threonine-protein kinase